MNAKKIEKTIRTRERLQVIDVTNEVENLIDVFKIRNGVLSLWVPHTTACITVNENDEPLWRDMLKKFSELAPKEDNYEHRANAHAHILSSLIKPCLQIPVIEGKMPLGTWQRILFIELDGPRSRTLKINMMY